MIFIIQKFEETPVLGNEWSHFFMKSGLIESIVLESGASVSARACVTNWQSGVFDAVPQRREKTGLRRLILHDDNA